jgi:hypothetical protein
MIANANARPSPDSLHRRFLALMPRLERHARIYFRHIPCADQRADKVAETIALAWKWFLRLQERGKDVEQFPMVFTFLAAQAVRSGRRLCGQEPAKDVLSTRAQHRHDFQVETLSSSTQRPYATFVDWSEGSKPWMPMKNGCMTIGSRRRPRPRPFASTSQTSSPACRSVTENWPCTCPWAIRARWRGGSFNCRRGASRSCVSSGASNGAASRAKQLTTRSGHQSQRSREIAAEAAGSAVPRCPAASQIGQPETARHRLSTMAQEGGDMAKAMLIDEIHVTVFARRGLREATYNAIQRTFHSRRFLTELKTSVRASSASIPR